MSKTIATSGKGWAASATFTRSGKKPVLRLTIIETAVQEAVTEDIDIRELVRAVRGEPTMDVVCDDPDEDASPFGDPRKSTG